MAKTLDQMHQKWMSDPVYHREFAKADAAIELGIRVRKLRIDAGLSQDQLGHLAGCSRAAIARIESGDADPRIDTLRSIGAALGVEVVLTLSDPSAA
jgi:DNA-binding XRE family transcriptional regulator